MSKDNSGIQFTIEEICDIQGALIDAISAIQADLKGFEENYTAYAILKTKIAKFEALRGKINIAMASMPGVSATEKEMAILNGQASVWPTESKSNFKEDVLPQDRLDFPVFLDRQENLQQSHSEELSGKAQLQLHANSESVLDESRIRIQNFLLPKDTSQ